MELIFPSVQEVWSGEQLGGEMSIKFSASKNVFFPDGLSYASIPEDVIEVSDEDFQRAMDRPSDHVLSVVDGMLMISQSVSQALTLDQQKAIKMAELKRMLEAVSANLISAYPESERALWPQLYDEARAFLQSADASVPILASIVSGLVSNGQTVTVAEYAAKVILKADSYQSSVVKLIAIRKALSVQISMALTVDVLNGIRLDLIDK